MDPIATDCFHSQSTVPATVAIVTQSLSEVWKQREESPARTASKNDSAGVAELCLAFTAATGWPVKFTPRDETSQDPDLMGSAPVDPGVGNAPGHVRLDLGQPRGDEAARASRQSAERLAAGIGRILGQLGQARQTIREREAELAAGVPVVVRAVESTDLARLLESVLRSGAEACECQAAALYMLDEATSVLKLRASWGLPIERLLQPPRPLNGAVADLEALLGHAVALERANAFGPWRVPEEFAAALCVPVSTPDVPLGTLWFFADRPREFTDAQTGIAEVVSGRLAAELERAMLLALLRERQSDRIKG